MLSILLSIVVPILICASLGYLWARLGRAFDADFVTSLIINVGAPSLVFHTLANLTVARSSLGLMVAASIVGLAGAALVGAALLRAAGLPVVPLLPSVMFGNTGNMGLPLCLLAFGEEGLGLAVGVFATHSVLMFTLGAAMAAGTWSPGALVREPLLYAVAGALVFLMAGIPPPHWVNSTTHILAGMTIPLMLIALGVSLSRLRIGRLWQSLLVAVLRLSVGFGLAVVLTWAFGLTGAERGVLIVQLAMPVAVFNYLFAQRHSIASQEVAGGVVISTALAFVLMPALLWFALDSHP